MKMFLNIDKKLFHVKDMTEYKSHGFRKDWHDKVEEFIEENDLAFDSPKYFIKFCVNKYMDEFDSKKSPDLEYLETMWSKISEKDIDIDKQALNRAIYETNEELSDS